MNTIIPKVTLLFLMLFFTNAASFAQKHYLDGYMILSNGDTVIGKVKDRKEQSVNSKLYEKIRFKSEKGKGRRYKP